MSENFEQIKNYYVNQALDFSRRSNNLVTNSNTIDTELQEDNDFDTYEDFISKHKTNGTLRVQVSSAQGIFPVENASVTVSLNLKDGKKILYNTATDTSGIADSLILPTLPSALSKAESTANKSGTQYTVTVFHPAFMEQIVDTVTIFENIETILPISLMPTVVKEGE